MSKEQEFNEEYEEDFVEDKKEEGTLSDIKKYGTILVVALIVVVAGLYAYNYFTEQSAKENAEATKHLARITPLLNQGDYERALNGDANIVIDNEKLLGFKDIANKYSGTEAGLVASFYAGKALLMQGKFSEAKNYFNTALANENSEIKVGAYSGLGACLEQENNYKEASVNYESAANLVEQIEIKSRLLYFVGLTAENAKDKERAKSFYEKVVKMNAENVYSEFAGLSSSGLLRLGTKIDWVKRGLKK